MDIKAYVKMETRELQLEPVGALCAGEVVNFTFDGPFNPSGVGLTLTMYNPAGIPVATAACSVVNLHSRLRTCSLDLATQAMATWADGEFSDTEADIVLADAETTYACVKIPVKLRPITVTD